MCGGFLTFIPSGSILPSKTAYPTTLYLLLKWKVQRSGWVLKTGWPVLIKEPERLKAGKKKTAFPGAWFPPLMLIPKPESYGLDFLAAVSPDSAAAVSTTGTSSIAAWSMMWSMVLLLKTTMYGQRQPPAPADLTPLRENGPYTLKKTHQWRKSGTTAYLTMERERFILLSGAAVFWNSTWLKRCGRTISTPMERWTSTYTET